MLIAQVEPPQEIDGGDYYYRTYAPGVMMAREEGVYVVNLTSIHRKREEIVTTADVLVLKNVCDPDFLPIIAARKQAGKPTVYELADNLGAVEPWNPVYFFYSNKENVRLIQQFINYCDALQVTVPKLERLYGYLNARRIVFANQMLSIPPQREFGHLNEVVIGWGGSHGHYEDMAQIAEPLGEWMLRKSQVRLNLMCSDPIWNLFDRVPQTKKTKVPPGSISAYTNFLQGIDIGIAPLKDTPFNQCRSDVKFLEYAVSGVVPVMQKIEPYIPAVEIGRTGYLFKDADELLGILDNLLENTAQIRNVAESGRSYVLKERLQKQHASSRIEFYKSLCDKIYAPGSMMSNNLSLFDQWSRLRGAQRKGRYLSLEASQYESLLQNGLIFMQLENNRKAALECFKAASVLEPQDYLPSLFGASVYSEPIDCLQKAIRQNPHSLKCWILLGDAFARANQVREAFSCFDSAAALFPKYDVPFSRTADLLKKIGEQSQAMKCLQKARARRAPYTVEKKIGEATGVLYG